MTSFTGRNALQAALLLAAALDWQSGACRSGPVFPEGTHTLLIERVGSAQADEYRRILADFDSHVASNPQDEIAAVERCRFVTHFAYAEEFPVAAADEESEACQQSLARGPHAATPAVRLFLLQQKWGVEAIDEAEALLPSAETWTSSQRAALHARLSELYGVEDPDQSGKHAILAVRLDPASGRQLVAAEYLVRVGEKRGAIEMIESMPAGNWNAWSLRTAVELMLRAGDTRAAQRLVAARNGVELDPSMRFSLARALLEAGEQDAGRSLLDGATGMVAADDGSYKDVAAMRALVALQRDFGSESEAIAAYEDLRTAGAIADPFGWYRLSLAFDGIQARWTRQDARGIGYLALVLGLVALLPALVVVPIHYWSVTMRLRGFVVSGDGDPVPWKLRHLWHAVGSMAVIMVAALYVFAYPSFESAFGNVIGSAPYLAGPADDLALGRAFLWGTVFALIASIPLMRRLPLQSLLATRWSIARSLLGGAGLALGLVFLAMIFHGVKASAGPAIGPGSDTILGMRGIHQAYGAWTLLGFAVLLIPMLEEFVFRGVFLRVAARHLAFWVAALIQAVVFVLWHEEIGDFPVLFAFAMIAAWLAARSGGLLAPVTFHAIVNLIAISQVLQHGAVAR